MACLLALPAAEAVAAERGFTLRYSTNVNGQIAIVGNTGMQCPLGTVDPLLNSGCSAARDGTGSRNNNSFDMQLLDADADPTTFQSSSATLTLPAAGRVLFAGLYWTGIQKKGDVVKGANGFIGVPQNPPNEAAIGTVRLMAPGATAYATITASQVDTAPIALTSGFGAFADVTALVASAGSGTYTVADIQSGTGGNIAAGWSLVVAYSDPAQPLRNLSVFDGLLVVSGQQTVSIPVSGFKTPATGPVRTAIGLVAAEGDAGATGDYLTLNDTVLTDALHPPNNTENSTIAHYGAHFTAKTPDWRNQLGYDSSLFTADGILANGATTAMFRAKTNGDTYAPQAITFATELFSQNVTLTKTVTEIDGDSEPGATLEYTITATNNGAANALDVELVDPIPGGTTFKSAFTPTASNGNVTTTPVNGAIVARLGTGATATAGGTLAPNASASVTFRVDIDADRPLGDVIDNVATLEFTSPDLGLPISTVANADTTVEYPDPGIAKRLVSSSGLNYTSELTVTNEGTLATLGTVRARDTADGAYTVTAMSGTGWSCSTSPSDCTRSDALAPGASYPPITVTVAHPAGQPVVNRGSIAIISGAGGGGQPSSGPATLNDLAIVDAGQAPSAALRIDKSALTGTVDVGALAGFRIIVANTGPAAATNAVVTDTLPAGLAYDAAASSTTAGSCPAAPGNAGTTTVTCALGTLAVCAEARITIRARAGQALAGASGSTVTNTATATSDVTATPVTDTANLTVRPATDLAVAKTASAATFDQGQTVTYTITATNAGPAAADRVQVVDRLPAAIDTGQTITATPSDSGSCTVSADVVQCLWTVSVPANATRTVTIAAPLKASFPTAQRQALNRLNVYSRTTELDPSDNYDEAVVTVIPAADLAAGASGPTTIPAGGDGTLTFTSTNNGPSTSTETTLTATLPEGLTPVSAPAGCTIAGRVVTCETGTLAVGATAERAVVARAADLTEASRDAEVVVASRATPDPVLENDRDTTPFVAGPVADLSIAKVADRAQVAPGGTVNYTLSIANAGPSSSTGAYLVDELTAGLTVVSATSSIPEGCTVEGRRVRCDAGEIVPGASFQVLIVATVGADRSGSEIVNTATLTPGAQADRNLANNTASATVRVTVTRRAKLSIKARATPSATYPKLRVRISATVRNVSGNAANDVRVCLSIPTGLRYASSKGTRDGTRVCFERAQLKPGRTTTVSYLATTRTPGQVRPRGTAVAGNAGWVQSRARLLVRPTSGGSGGVTG
ncbi:MAG: hypothetical protein ACKO7Q_02315 [Actinomycetota bacterium]